jgi:type I restriction enzyme, S subunit
MWRKLPLGALAEITSGGTPSRDIAAYWGGDIPWVTPTDVTACRTNYLCDTADRLTQKGLLNCSAKVLPAGTILFTSRATVGISRIAAVPVCTNQGFKSLTPLQGTNGKFLFYQVQRLRGAFERYAAGSTFPEINKKDTARIAIPHPVERRAQQKIAAVLTSIDTAIETTEALIDKYQQIKAGLMQDLFTRGVLPDGQLRPVRQHAPELYQETELGCIPNEWRVLRAGDLCSLITKGTTPPRTEMWEGDEGIRFFRVDNLTFDGQIDPAASTFRISLRTHSILLARSVCIAGDVLMNIVGPPLGKVGLVSPLDGEVNINQAIAVFRPTSRLSPSFLVQWLLSHTSKRWILQRAKQTSGQLNVTLAMCQDLPVPYMSLDEQLRIEHRMRAIDTLIGSERQRHFELGSQKLGLMQDLLTGKVPVKVDEPAVQTADA